MNRALRNCNPLNIRRVAGSAAWRGQRAIQTDAEFLQFDRIEWGLRAAFCILHTYARRYNVTCIADIVERWAPPCENNTERYINNVCRWTGMGGRQRLAEKDWMLLVSAMARQECGKRLDNETIKRSYELYKLTRT